MNIDSKSKTEQINRSAAAPVFFKLVDGDEVKVEKTVSDVATLSEHFGVTDILQLHNITHAPGEGMVITYALHLETGQDKETADKALSFLEHIFKNLFYKHPAYTEPIVL